MSNPNDAWEKLKQELLILRDENEDAHGIGACKTCGIEPEELAEKIDTILYSHTTAIIAKLEEEKMRLWNCHVDEDSNSSRAFNNALDLAIRRWTDAIQAIKEKK